MELDPSLKYFKPYCSLERAVKLKISFELGETVSVYATRELTRTTALWELRIQISLMKSL